MQKSMPNNRSSVAKRDAVRCAIYARCASGVHEQSNTAEQIRICTEYADKHGWKVAADLVQADIAVSALSLAGCKSLIHLLDAAQREPGRFNCVIVADISRLGRSSEHVIRSLRAFRARGVFVQAVHGEFDSRTLLPTLEEEFINVFASI